LNIKIEKSQVLQLQNTCDISYEAESSLTNQFFAKVITGLTDIIIGGICMNEPIYQIVGILNTNLHQMYQNRVPASSLNDLQEDNKKTTHKYMIENKSIVYEKYDRHGKLISRVPWSLKPIDEKA
jgi:hypothetical protein